MCENLFQWWFVFHLSEQTKHIISGCRHGSFRRSVNFALCSQQFTTRYYDYKRKKISMNIRDWLLLMVVVFLSFFVSSKNKFRSSKSNMWSLVWFYFVLFMEMLHVRFISRIWNFWILQKTFIWWQYRIIIYF